MPELYMATYYKYTLRNHKNFLYFPISSQHPHYNYLTTPSFYKEARIIAKVNLNSGKVVDLMGRYSPTYQDKNTPQFSLINFDINSKGEIFVSFEADSLIYHYDNDFNIIGCFGASGKKMEANYTEIIDLNVFKKYRFEERKKFGFYNWLEIEQEKLFRCYSRGKAAKNNGLQIYNMGKKLIADVSIPKDMNKVIGYIEPYFYSNIVIDEMNEKMWIYRFKLKD